jgi:hypothetical protein
VGKRHVFLGRGFFSHDLGMAGELVVESVTEKAQCGQDQYAQYGRDYCLQAASLQHFGKPALSWIGPGGILSSLHTIMLASA